MTWYKNGAMQQRCARDELKTPIKRIPLSVTCTRGGRRVKKKKKIGKKPVRKPLAHNVPLPGYRLSRAPARTDRV